MDHTQMKKKSLILFTFICLFCSAYAQEGTLFLTTTPREAIIYINDQIRADLTPIAFKLSPGKYQIDIKKSGKQSVSFEVFISQGSEIHKDITLAELPSLSSFEQEEINLLKIIHPLRSQFETFQEFERRRRQLLNDFNQAVVQRNPLYQAGLATLEKDSYDTYHGTLPVDIQWQNWTKRFSLPDKSSIAILPQQVESFWKEGLQKPVFLYLDTLKGEAILKKVVVVGVAKEWPIHEVSGYLSITASDQLAHLLTAWMEKYHELYPNVNFEILLKKDSEAFSPLIEGRSHMTLMAHQVTERERDLFEKNYGYPPLGFQVALDALAIYVHQDNPIWKVTLPQLDAIFSTTRKCGFQNNIGKWGELDLEPRTKDWLKKQLRAWIGLVPLETQTINWHQLDIQMEGLNTPELLQTFKEKVLCGGEFKSSLVLHDNSAEIIKKIGQSPNSIGFAKFDLDNIVQAKTVVIYPDHSHPLIQNLFPLQMPTLEELANGDYPLARSFWIYVNKMPDKSFSQVINRLVKLILSSQGQNTILKEGFIALSPDLISDQLDNLIPQKK